MHELLSFLRGVKVGLGRHSNLPVDIVGIRDVDAAFINLCFEILILVTQ